MFLHRKGRLSILPTDEVIKEWAADYKTMRENMIVRESLTWEDLLKSVKRIEDKFNINQFSKDNEPPKKRN
ncbi:hypothetical protein L1283_005030 [Sphingobacterium sp. HSC-15S19]